MKNAVVEEYGAKALQDCPKEIKRLWSDLTLPGITSEEATDHPTLSTVVYADTCVEGYRQLLQEFVLEGKHLMLVLDALGRLYPDADRDILSDPLLSLFTSRKVLNAFPRHEFPFRIPTLPVSTPPARKPSRKSKSKKSNAKSQKAKPKSEKKEGVLPKDFKGRAIWMLQIGRHGSVHSVERVVIKAVKERFGLARAVTREEVLHGIRRRQPNYLADLLFLLKKHGPASIQPHKMLHISERCTISGIFKTAVIHQPRTVNPKSIALLGSSVRPTSEVSLPPPTSEVSLPPPTSEVSLPEKL